MTLGIVLLNGPRRGVFLTSEAPLWMRAPKAGKRECGNRGVHIPPPNAAKTLFDPMNFIVFRGTSLP